MFACKIGVNTAENRPRKGSKKKPIRSSPLMIGFSCFAAGAASQMSDATQGRICGTQKLHRSRPRAILQGTASSQPFYLSDLGRFSDMDGISNMAIIW